MEHQHNYADHEHHFTTTTTGGMISRSYDHEHPITTSVRSSSLVMMPPECHHSTHWSSRTGSSATRGMITAGTVHGHNHDHLEEQSQEQELFKMGSLVVGEATSTAPYGQHVVASWDHQEENSRRQHHFYHKNNSSRWQQNSHKKLKNNYNHDNYNYSRPGTRESLSSSENYNKNNSNYSSDEQDSNPEHDHGSNNKRAISEDLQSIYSSILSGTYRNAVTPPCRNKGSKKGFDYWDPTYVNNYDYYAVLDFEATCEHDHSMKDVEIIEFPTVIIDRRSGRVIDEFRMYSKPVINPVLTNFCKTLTGIRQEQVDTAPKFEIVYEAWREFMKQYPNSLFITCGDWDFESMLPRQLGYEAKHSEYSTWCNIKILFSRFLAKHPPHKINKKRRKLFGMDMMLRIMGLELEGWHHCGLDDSRNIAKIVKEMVVRFGEDVMRPTTVNGVRMIR